MKAMLAGTIGVAGVGIMVAFAGVSGVRTPASPGPTQAVWTETSWPFPIDQWGAGKAFVCAPSDCGTRINLTVRPKVGYCNCNTGIADEAELDRVSDNELAGLAVQPRGRARPVRIGWMTGLSRSYMAASKGIISVAYNDECDVVVALATFDQADAVRVDAAAVDFLGSRPMVLWARSELGLEFIRRDW
jgi:hypothetical protein